MQRAPQRPQALFVRRDFPPLLPINADACQAHDGKGCAASSANHRVRIYHSGAFDQRCPHCQALLLRSETPQDGNTYTKCCAGGKVDMRDRYNELQNMPEPLNAYADADPSEPEARHFRRTSHIYNTELAFGSITSQRDPQRLPGGGVPACRINGEMTYRCSDMYRNPDVHQRPRWSEQYILDPADALPEREQNLQQLRNMPDFATRSKHRPEVLKKLDNMIRRHHPYARAFKLAHEVLKEKKEERRRQGLPEVRVVHADL